PGAEEAPGALVHRSNDRVALYAAITVVGLALAAWAGFLFLRRPADLPRVTRSYLKAMPGTSYMLTSLQSGFALSPDGLRLAYMPLNAEGKSVLWIRPIDSLRAQPLAGTEGASFPFWSPNSRSVGFFAGGKLKRIDTTGGPPLTICDAITARGGTWNQ